MMIQIKKIGNKNGRKRNNFKGVLRNLKALKKRDVKVEIERNKKAEYREIKREKSTTEN